MKYRASRDGFSRHNFHTKCDKVLNTLTIIEATNGNIFGAFSEKAWANDKDISDPKAFIISLINKENKPFKAMINSGNSKGYNVSSYGPYFGFDTCHKTFDILIVENSNANQSCISNFGYSFKHQDYPAGSEKARNILAGSQHFQTIEIEVFKKKD